MNIMKIGVTIYCVFVFSVGAMAQQQESISQIPSIASEAVKKSIKKAFSHDYKIDRVPVESGIYLQHMITSYNAHMKHAIMEWLKKDLLVGASYSKELYYLLEQLDTVATVKEAVVMLARAASAYKSMRQEESSYQVDSAWQEQAYGMIALQASVALVTIARAQLLTILDEINSSLVYWRDQKQSPVKYFLHKSPMKWFVGQRQADEVAVNIKKLEKLEHDVRVVLGRLTKHIYAFDIDGDTNGAYAWIEQLLSMLTCPGIKKEQLAADDSRFEKIAEKLRLKLSCMHNLKDTILSKISAMIKPGHIARNWLLYTGALAAAYAARSYYLKNQEYVIENIGPEALLGYARQAQEYTQKYVVVPLSDTIKAIFVGNTSISPDQEKAGEINRDALKKTLKELATPKSGWLWGTYGVIGGKPLSEKELNYILAEEEKGNLDPLLELLNRIDVSTSDIVFRNSVKPLIRIILEYATLSIGQGKKITQEQLRIIEEQFRVVRNLLVVSPSILFAGFGAVGLSKLYKSITVRDYSTIRLALLEINSLFIESAAPLSDHDYGKLIYLLQGLKAEAMRYLTQEDMRGDFLVDIAKLESNKFDVETKRSIIQNMFMKYPFLALNAKSA